MTASSALGKPAGRGSTAATLVPGSAAREKGGQGRVAASTTNNLNSKSVERLRKAGFPRSNGWSFEPPIKGGTAGGGE